MIPNPRQFRLVHGNTVVLLNTTDGRTWWWVVTDPNHQRAKLIGRSTAADASLALTDMLNRVTSGSGARLRTDLAVIEAMALRDHIHIPATALRVGDLVWLGRDLYAHVDRVDRSPETGATAITRRRPSVRGHIDDGRVVLSPSYAFELPTPADRGYDAILAATDLCNVLVQCDDEVTIEFRMRFRSGVDAPS